MKKIFILVVSSIIFSGCNFTDAKIASRNLSKAADMFEINRRIVFYNGITDNYLMTIEGRCSLDADSSNKVSVTCKDNEGFKKHYLGLSDNVTYMVEQIGSANVGVMQYRVVFKPSALIPQTEIKLSKPEIIYSDHKQTR